MADKDGPSGHGRLRNLALDNLEEKRKQLETSRRRVEDEIQHFQHEIQRIQSEIQRSEGERDRIDLSLKENRAEHGKIVNGSSTLLNLPTEVTCMIFELSSSTGGLGNTSRKEQSLRLPEVVISQVCTHWRDIALSCASLWTRFYFSVDEVKYSMSNTITRFDTYLKRSGSLDLELFLDFRISRWTNLSRKRNGQLLDMAIKNINRWKIVTLLLHQHQDLQALLPSLLTASAPKLEYFVYSSWHIYSPDFRSEDNPNISLLQGGAPKLLFFQLRCNSLYIPPPANLTTLQIDSRSPDIPYSWETFLAILSMPFLSNLSISGNIFSAPDRIPIVNMNNLTHLRYSNNDMSDTLPFLRAPLLKILVIHYDSNFNPEEDASQQDARGLADNLYSFPSLKTLVLLESLPSSASFVRHIPLVTNNIESLILGFYPEREYLPWPNERVCEYWPKLTTITLLCGPFRYPHKLEALSAFVVARDLNVRISRVLHVDLQAHCADEYRVIQTRRTLDVLDLEAARTALEATWPPGFDFPEYALNEDPFQFRNYMY